MSKDFVDLTDRPDLYEWLHRERAEDIPMYLSLAKDHSEVLECGIGTGRIAIPLAETGRTVFGIDSSAEMLQRLETKLKAVPEAVRGRIRAYQADMRNFDLQKKFSFIYAPYFAFNYLLSIQDQKASLAAIRDHLIQDGTLVLELLSFSLSPHWLDNDTTIKQAEKKFDSETGKLIEMWRIMRFDSSTQIVEQDRYFRFYNRNGLLEDEVVVLWRNRLFFIGEIQLLLEAAGFEIENIYGDYTLGKYRHKSEFAVVVARLKK